DARGRVVETYCNVYVHDVTRSLGAAIPLSVRDGRGQTQWLNANRMQDWLRQPGNGWRSVGAAEAQRLANQNRPVVASWKNPTGGHGHIAVVRPGTYSATYGPAIAHAGTTPSNNATVAQGFGRTRMSEVRYFVYAGR